MARIRSIKPEFWQDERLGEVSIAARLLFMGLTSHADDEGRLRGNNLLIRAQVFPYNPDVDIEKALEELVRTRRIIRYVVDGERFIFVRNFAKHQRIDRPTKSAFPAPPEALDESSTSIPRGLDEASLLERRGVEGRGEEGRGEEGSGGEAAPTSAKVHVPVAVVAPTKPPDEWTAPDFWAHAQSNRTEGGYLPEKPPPIRKLGDWWSRCLMTPGVTVHALKGGWSNYGQDPYWEKPGYPFNGFMSQWAKYTRPEVADGAAA